MDQFEIQFVSFARLVMLAIVPYVLASAGLCYVNICKIRPWCCPIPCVIWCAIIFF